jgi:hypothetical protein
MPMKSLASTTAELELLTQAVQVSTWPTGRLRPASDRADLAQWGFCQSLDHAMKGRGECCSLDLLDVTDDGIGTGTDARLVDDTGGRDTVEILAADGDTNHRAAEVRAVSCYGRLEGLQLVGEDRITAGTP